MIASLELLWQRSKNNAINPEATAFLFAVGRGSSCWLLGGMAAREEKLLDLRSLASPVGEFPPGHRGLTSAVSGLCCCGSIVQRCVAEGRDDDTAERLFFAVNNSLLKVSQAHIYNTNISFATMKTQLILAATMACTAGAFSVSVSKYLGGWYWLNQLDVGLSRIDVVPRSIANRWCYKSP